MTAPVGIEGSAARQEQRLQQQSVSEHLDLLESVLATQLEILEELATLARQKRQVLLRGDAASLEQLTAAEAAAAQRLQAAEAERQQAAERLATLLTAPLPAAAPEPAPPAPRLAELARAAGGPNGERLMAWRERLGDAVESLRRENNSNLWLLRRSMEFTGGLLSLFAAEGEGALLVDRRV